MIEQSIHQSQQLKQEQTITPQQILSLEILQSPALELQAKISEELAQNPVLEQDSPEDAQIPLHSEADSDDSSGSDSGDSGSDEKLSELMGFADSWQNQLPPQINYRSRSEDDEEKRQHFFDSITEEPSLQEQLLEQLRLSECPEDKRHLAELLIGSIDERGYLRSNLRDLATVGMADLREMEDALEIVHRFDPPGIGARDLKECLLLQLKAKGRQNSMAARLVREHLDDVGTNKLPFVAKKLGITMDRLESILDEIKKLNPFPGSAISSEAPAFVVPEFAIEKKGDSYQAVPLDNSIPKLRISDKYLELLESPSISKEDKDYIRGKILQGKNLIRSVDQRKDTIAKIVEIIIDTQFDFFEKGVEGIRPLKMQQVADKIGLHETTVSRAIAGKYLQTPGGIFEMKYFFSGGYHADNGQEISSRLVMKKIQDMISKENSSSPLSDHDICEALNKDGIPVARRTVAKYREELGIASSRMRREF